MFFFAWLNSLPRHPSQRSTSTSQANGSTPRRAAISAIPNRNTVLNLNITTRRSRLFFLISFQCIQINTNEFYSKNFDFYWAKGRQWIFDRGWLKLFRELYYRCGSYIHAHIDCISGSTKVHFLHFHYWNWTSFWFHADSLGTRTVHTNSSAIDSLFYC